MTDPVKAKIIETPCWKWEGTVSDIGYARRKKNGKNLLVHRVVFEAVMGDVPKSMVLDHLCRNRSCVNPFHLEVVTNKENVLRGVGISAVNARKTECKNGHALPLGKPVRRCIPCYKAYQADYRLKHKQHG